MFTAMTLWAGSWVSGKLISGGSLHFQFIFWRFVITVVCFLVIYIISIRKNNTYQRLSRVFGNPALLAMVFLSAIAIVGYNAMSFVKIFGFLDYEFEAYIF